MLPFNEPVRQTYQRGKRRGVATIKAARTLSMTQLEIYGVTSTNKIS